MTRSLANPAHHSVRKGIRRFLNATLSGDAGGVQAVAARV